MRSTRVIDAEARTTIRRPAATVFGWLTEPTLVPQWVTGLVASRPVGPAEVRLGAQSVEEVSLRGRTVAMHAEIVELVELEGGGRVIASRIETPDGPLLSRFVVDDLGDACSVTHTLTAEVSDHRWVPSRLIAAGMTRQIRRDLAALTQLVEAAP